MTSSEGVDFGRCVATSQTQGTLTLYFAPQIPKSRKIVETNVMTKGERYRANQPSVTRAIDQCHEVADRGARIPENQLDAIQCQVCRGFGAVWRLRAFQLCKACNGHGNLFRKPLVTQ